jgi:hypothetical protein
MIDHGKRKTSTGGLSMASLPASGNASFASPRPLLSEREKIWCGDNCREGEDEIYSVKPLSGRRGVGVRSKGKSRTNN